MSDILQKFREKLDNLNMTDYCGLNSPGLTCYLNSVLQVLFMTEDFRKAIERSCSEDSTTIDLHLQELFNDLKTQITKTHNITKKLEITDVYEQRDAAEYFEKILHLSSPGASKIFKGELNHKTRCLQCKKTNESRSFFWMLPLVVEDSRYQTYSVEQGLKTFFKGETVSEDNRMYCNQCHEKREAEIMCEITHNPEILTLLLKRFRFDYTLKCFVKLQCKVEVPQTLHFESCTYDLYALVNHYGNLTGGHYTAQIKSFETGAWYYFNDEHVKMVKPLFGNKHTSVKSSEAYLLMYRKRSTYSDNSDENKCAYSEAVADGRCEETVRGQDLVRHHLLTEEPNHRGKQFSGDISERNYDHILWMKHQNSGGAEKKLLKETVTPQSETYGDLYKSESNVSKMQRDEEHETPNRQQRERDPRKHMFHLTSRWPHGDDGRVQLNNRFEQNLNSRNERLPVNDTPWEGKDIIVPQNRTRAIGVTNSSPTESTVYPTAYNVVKHKGDGAAELRTEATGIRRRRKPDVSVGDSVIPSGYSPCSASTCTCCRADIICKGSNVQMQHYVEPTQEWQTANLRKMKNKSKDYVQKQAWRY